MTRRSESFPLEHTSPGTVREILVHRFGKADSNKKAYIQAALHSDEIPPLLVAHHLARQLDRLEAKDEVIGEVVLVPYANPIGLGQFVNGGHNGRNELAGGGNFNRNWPNLSAGLAESLEGKLKRDEASNIATVQDALRAAIESWPLNNELDSLRKTLAKLAVEAELVMDLHCDDEALMHLYMLESHAETAEVWGRELASEVTLLSDDSGGGPFDETFTAPWLTLSKAFPDLPIPLHCVGATVELRGYGDVCDEVAQKDARAIIRILQRHGFIAGKPDELPPARCQATPLPACEVLHAPGPGVLSYCARPGDEITKGDVIAWLIDPSAHDPEKGRKAIYAGTDGIMLSRLSRKYVQAGTSIAKIAGTTPLEGRKAGALLES